LGRLKIRHMKMQLKNRLRKHKKMFIRSTALYVFQTKEPFVTTETKYVFYYSSSPLNEQAVKWVSFT